MASVDMDAVVQATVRQLGADHAMLRLELNAQRALNEALAAELEQAKAAKDSTEPDPA